MRKRTVRVAPGSISPAVVKRRLRADAAGIDRRRGLRRDVRGRSPLLTYGEGDFDAERALVVGVVLGEEHLVGAAVGEDPAFAERRVVGEHAAAGLRAGS